jgi:hypothetical protein
METAIKNDDVAAFEWHIRESEYTDPAYCPNNKYWIFHWIFMYESTKILDYFEKYLDNHPVSYLTHDYCDYFEMFRMYKFLQSLTDDHKMIRILYYNKLTYKIYQMHHILIWKLIKGKNLNKILQMFYIISTTDFECLYKLGNMITNLSCLLIKPTYDELLIDRFLRPHGYWMMTGKFLMDTFKDFSLEEKKEFFSRFPNIRYYYNYYMLPLYDNMPDQAPYILHYVASCTIGDLDNSLKTLNVLTGLSFTMTNYDDLLRSKKVKKIINNRASNVHLIQALDNSIESKNTGLIDFNKKLLFACHPRAKPTNHELDPKDKESLNRKINRLIYTNDLQEWVRVLTFINDHNIKDIYIPMNPVIYYFCCVTGRRYLFRNVQIRYYNYYYHNGIKTNLQTIDRYFDKMNGKLKEILMDHKNLLFPRLLNIVVEYALY